MSNLASSITLEEQRVFIKFQVLLGTPVHEIEKLLKKTVRNNAMKRPTIIKWVERFQQGETSTEDRPRSSRPKSSRDESH
jgi:transposase